MKIQGQDAEFEEEEARVPKSDFQMKFFSFTTFWYIVRRHQLQYNKQTSVALKYSGNPCSSRKQLDRYAEELWRISAFKQVYFFWKAKYY